MSRRAASIAIYLAIAVIGAGLLWRNHTRFRNAQKIISTDERLEYLPSPEVSRLLAFGHSNTVAKMRWIASFPYFNHQIEVRDDRALGGGHRGSFDRLYDSLIALDPYYLPFYLHASMTTGAIVDDAHTQLRYLCRGVHAMPDSLLLWLNLITIFRVDYDLEERNPEQFESLLLQWAAVDERVRGSDHGMSGVQAWLAAMARRQERGLAQLAYWAQILGNTHPESPQGALAQRTMREQLAMYGERRLEKLITAFRSLRRRTPENLEECLDPMVILEAYRDVDSEVITAEPLGVGPGQEPFVRPDPYGWPWRLEDGEIISTGLQHVYYQRHVTSVGSVIKQQNLPMPRRIEDLPIELDPPPPGAHPDIIGDELGLEFDPPPFEPWTIEELIQAVEPGYRAASAGG